MSDSSKRNASPVKAAGMMKWFARIERHRLASPASQLLQRRPRTQKNDARMRAFLRLARRRQTPESRFG